MPSDSTEVCWGSTNIMSREVLEGILFQPGDIVEHGHEAEEETD